MTRDRLLRLEKVRSFAREVCGADVARATDRVEKARGEEERAIRAAERLERAQAGLGALPAAEWVAGREALETAAARSKEASRSTFRAERERQRALLRLRRARVEEEKITHLLSDKREAARREELRVEARRLDEVGQRRKGDLS